MTSNPALALRLQSARPVRRVAAPDINPNNQTPMISYQLTRVLSRGWRWDLAAGVGRTAFTIEGDLVTTK